MYNGREDQIPVSRVEEGTKWKWVPTDKIVVIKDSAPVAANAMAKHVATCCIEYCLIRKAVLTFRGHEKYQNSIFLDHYNTCFKVCTI